MQTESIAAFWRAFNTATGIDAPREAWSFGNDPRTATKLGFLVRDGVKRATTSLRSWYEGDGALLMPVVGALGIILGGTGEPLCVIRTTRVEIERFGAVTAEFARVEGEGDGSLAHWRRVHLAFFAAEGRPAHDETEVVLEWFELLWAPSPEMRNKLE